MSKVEMPEMKDVKALDEARIDIKFLESQIEFKRYPKNPEPEEQIKTGRLVKSFRSDGVKQLDRFE